MAALEEAAALLLLFLLLLHLLLLVAVLVLLVVLLVVVVVVLLVLLLVVVFVLLSLPTLPSELPPELLPCHVQWTAREAAPMKAQPLPPLRPPFQVRQRGTTATRRATGRGLCCPPGK